MFVYVKVVEIICMGSNARRGDRCEYREEALYPEENVRAERQVSSTAATCVRDRLTDGATENRTGHRKRANVPVGHLCERCPGRRQAQDFVQVVEEEDLVHEVRAGGRFEGDADGRGVGCLWNSVQDRTFSGPARLHALASLGDSARVAEHERIEPWSALRHAHASEASSKS